jgi:NADPH2:quinone reductase
LELLGSGFGSASMKQLFTAIREMFQEAATKPFVNGVKLVALRDVEALWTSKEEGVRLVFQP